MELVRVWPTRLKAGGGRKGWVGHMEALGRVSCSTLRHEAVKECCELTAIFKITTPAAMDEPVCKREMLDSDQEMTTAIQTKMRVRKHQCGEVHGSCIPVG